MKSSGLAGFIDPDNGNTARRGGALPRSALTDSAGMSGIAVEGTAQADGETALRICYLVTQYPKVSHSFIRREIHALERRGLDVMRISVRGWDAELVDAEDLQERARTAYVLKKGLPGLATQVARVALTAPLRFVAAFALALRMSKDAERSLPYHLAYLAEACWIVPQLQRHGSMHLHAHFGTNSAEVAMLVHELCGIPYSFTAHGPDEFDSPKAIGLGEKIRRSAFAVAVSNFGRSQMLRWVEQEHWHKVRVVHCGLERAFHDKPAIPVPDSPRLVCVGRLSAQKGQLLLIEAAAQLVRDGLKFELVLAGDGEMRAEIEAAILRHGIGHCVRITGWIDSDRVRQEIQAARILVLPSFAEGLPVVIMEAMALRRPVLTTFVAGIPELVIPEENGWLVPAGSIGDLVRALKTCLSTPLTVVDEMGERARERVLKRHDIDAEAARLVGYFHESVSSGVSLVTVAVR
jgi:colanic acid/amylovoran biosynthesis glycosyltransferase